MGTFEAVRVQGRHVTDRAGHGRRPIGWRLLSGQTIQGIFIAILAGGLFWLVWIYGHGLRDPRYLDGWVLAGGMIVQLQFHFAVKAARLSPASVKRWRKAHIFVGYFLIAAFFSHANFTLPDTAFEWALWLGFVLVVLSGVVSAYLTWSVSAKRDLDANITYERIPKRCAELARDIEAAVAQTEPDPVAIALPAQPHDAWISDLYTNHLRDFFRGPRNAVPHLFGSQQPLNRLIKEIDSLSGYVDTKNQEKLSVIKDLVIEKDRLDFAHAYFGLTRGCLFVHVPVTYALIVMTVVHILVVYAFSSGDW